MEILSNFVNLNGSVIDSLNSKYKMSYILRENIKNDLLSLKGRSDLEKNDIETFFSLKVIVDNNIPTDIILVVDNEGKLVKGFRLKNR